MLKKSITYIDCEGKEHTDDFYFNLNKAELIEMEMNTVGGMEKFLKKIIKTNDNRALYGMFKDIVLRSYGVKGDDGIQFVKSKELRDQFEHTDAFSELLVELATNDGAASAFINGIIPQSLAKQLAANPPKIEGLNA